MDNCPVLSFLALFLELEVFLKDRGKTVSFQHASLMQDGTLDTGRFSRSYSKETLYPGGGGKKHPIVILKKIK